MIDNNAMGIGAKPEYLDSKFFYYYMKKLKMETYAESTTVPSVRKSRLEELLIDIPSFEKQKLIVNILSKIHNIINNRRIQLLKFEELIKARFVEMFGDLRANSKGWPIHTFREITEIITDGEHITPRRVDHGIYLLSARNVLDHSLQLDDVDYIDQEEYERISKRIVPMAGDVLISCSGSVGRCCMVPIGLKFQMVRSVAILRFKNILVPKYAEYMISSDELQDQISRAKTASSQANLFQPKLYPIMCSTIITL